MQDIKKQIPTIAIIGGGFSGTMTAIHLMRQSDVSLHIILINHRYPLAKGIAYSSYSNKHLLNVAAKNMSAFPDKSDDFLKWLKNHDNYGALDQNELPGTFLPRNIYGKYLKDTFENAIRKKSENVTIEFIHDEAIDLEIKDSRVQVYFSVSPTVIADKVVLAMGNPDPRHPDFNNDKFLNSNRYFPNPWLNTAVSHPDIEENILIVGNGLTMVDVVLGLREKNFQGKIYSLSPHGFRILPHRKFEPYTGLLEEIHPPYKLKDLVSIFKSHVNKQRKKGESGEAVVDALRPLTQKIWQDLNEKEKERFMYYLRHMWGVARHRLPMDVHKYIQQMILDDKLEIVAGKILSVDEHESSAQVSIQRKNNQDVLKIDVSRIINCTGPESNITKIKNPLIRNMLESKIVSPGDLQMGFKAKADGTIIHPDGSESQSLFTIGSWLKGVLWESTAVPELRTQAKNLAEKLIGDSNKQIKS
ncbi:MAG TPA: FAD/NAD(P)-binding protein [Bacteroidia bacterium]|nr:FAD/NAD(P)-binding protein [Bacteroidia bacterium]